MSANPSVPVLLPSASLNPVAEDDEFTEADGSDIHDGTYPLKPISSDVEYDTDVELPDRKESFDATGKKAYYEACRKYKTNVVSYFLRHMADAEIEMPFHGVGIKGAKAIAAALIANTVTVKLNLRENSICAEGVKHLSEMLKENCYIADLNLSMNYLRAEGCQYVCDMLQHNINLRSLNLSHNEFGDSVGTFLLEAFKNNDKLTALDLSGNHLGDKVGLAVGPGINSNDAVEYLNLSWNQLRSKATQEIAAGLRANCTLKVIDLSWNGFSDTGAIALADAIKMNNTLTELHVGHNRIGVDGALSFAKALESNNTLEILQLDNNNITSRGAHVLLSAILSKQDSAIQQLHMKGVFVQDDFIQLYESSKESRNILVIATFRVKSPLEKVQDFVKGHKGDWFEAFSEVDRVQCSRVSVQQFKEILDKFSLPFTLEELCSLMEKLKKDSRGLIKYRDPLLGFEKEIIEVINAEA